MVVVYGNTFIMMLVITLGWRNWNGDEHEDNDQRLIYTGYYAEAMRVYVCMFILYLCFKSNCFDIPT